MVSGLTSWSLEKRKAHNSRRREDFENHLSCSEACFKRRDGAFLSNTDGDLSHGLHGLSHMGYTTQFILRLTASSVYPDHYPKREFALYTLRVYVNEVWKNNMPANHHAIAGIHEANSATHVSTSYIARCPSQPKHTSTGKAEECHTSNENTKCHIGALKDLAARHTCILARDVLVL